MTLAASLLLAYLLWKFLKMAAFAVSGRRSTVHLEENVLSALGEGNGTLPPVRYDETVVLYGPMNSGKTSMLHRLLLIHEDDDNNTSSSSCVAELPMTVSSMTANVIYLPRNPSSDGTRKEEVVRIIDYPGHHRDTTPFATVLQSRVSRMVFAIDSTSSVGPAASILYTLMNHSALLNNKTNHWDNDNNRLNVLIACTKKDVRGSKNYKRIKLQLRNEMERLRNVDVVMDETNSMNNGRENGSSKEGIKSRQHHIDLDNLENVPMQLHFVEVALGTSEGGGMDAVRDFVLNGVLPDNDKKLNK